MDGCQEARMAVTIRDTDCPRCGESVEIYIRDGALAADSTCDACGYIFHAGTPA